MKPESETKRKLLETAVELIWQSSYGAVSVDDICTKAGVNKGSFYYAFKSKSDLAVAALERFWETKRPLMDQIFSPLVPPVERLKNYCDLIIEDQNEKYRAHGKVLGCPFCSLGGEQSTQDENIRKKIEQMSTRKLKYIESLVRDFAAEGSLETNDPAGLARELYFYCLGILMQAKIENNIKVFDQLHHGCIRILSLKQPVVAAN
jgi:TetR/AcrR family transcriptional repressor of nem operon